MNCRRRFLPVLMLLAILAVSLFSGCNTRTEGEFDPYTVPIFSTVGSDIKTNSEQIKSKLDMAGNSSFRIDDNGAITYYRSESDEQIPIQMTDDEALRQATEYLNELGLLPKDEYRAYVSKVNRSGVDLTGGNVSTSETIWIDVFFYRVYNGVDVISDQEDGIILSFDAQGIRSLRYFWRAIETSKISADTKPISAEDAHHIYLDQWDSRHGTCCEPYESPEIFSAYIQINGTSRPCWVIAEDKMYTNAWFIDMFTGEVFGG